MYSGVEPEEIGMQPAGNGPQARSVLRARGSTQRGGSLKAPTVPTVPIEHLPSPDRMLPRTVSFRPLTGAEEELSEVEEEVKLLSSYQLSRRLSGGETDRPEDARLTVAKVQVLSQAIMAAEVGWWPR